MILKPLPPRIRPPSRMSESRCSPSPSRLRDGFTIVEMIVAFLGLGVMLAILIPMLVVAGRERRANEQRQFALQHATNLIERITAKDWTDLKPGTLEWEAPPVDVSAVLSDVKREITVNEPDPETGAKRVHVRVQWSGRPREVIAPVKLTAWVFPEKGSAP